VTNAGPSSGQDIADGDADHSEFDFDTEGKPPGRMAKRPQILALSGGGFRGLYIATFLAQVEAEANYNCRVSKHFDLLTGTSIGGLIAAGLALDIPAATIASKIRTHGPKIFPRIPVYTALKRTVFSAPYSTEALAEAVIETLGKANANRSMAAIDKPLAINAINYTHDRPETFRSKGLAGNNASAVSVLNAVLASAAAPTYFPPKTIGTDTFIDGGLIANAPELVGVSEACGRLGYSLDRLYVLALGTAARRQGASLASIGRPGGVSWVVRRRLVDATMAAQEALAVSQCTTLLGSRYLRIDNEPAQNQVAAIGDMDRTSPLAVQTLETLAQTSWAQHKGTRAFRDFFEGYQAPRPL
jgi:predicted patatin/cPLA2 family phospholipase